MSLIINRNFKRAKAQDAAAKDKTPDGWWEGKTIFAAFGWGKSVKGKVVSHKGGVIKLEDGTKFKESDAYDLYAIDSSASDAAELRVVHAKGIGKWWVEPNLSRFNDADREQTHKGRKEFPDREAAIKYARGTGKTFIVNDACEDSAELNNDADLRAALSKMADIAKRLTDAKVSFKSGWTPEGIGEIILEFPNIESARKYNYYKLFNAWEAARSQIVPRWAVNIGGYRVPRIEGNRMIISILHFST